MAVAIPVSLFEVELMAHCVSLFEVELRTGYPDGSLRSTRDDQAADLRSPCLAEGT